MSKSKTTVQKLALEASLGLEEALVLIWDAGLSHVAGPGSVLKGSDLDVARSAIGLYTRRELASLEHWSNLLNQPPSAIQDFLELENLGRPRLESRLTNRQISRLRQVAATAPAATQIVVPVEPREEAIPKLLWETVGRSAPTRYLSVDEVTAIHDELARDFSQSSDPIFPEGVKDYSLLESAVSRPQTALGGDLKYPTVEMAAAALLCAIVQNHAFHNGNKRTALVAALAFLDANGVMLECADDDIFRLLLQLAAHTVHLGKSKMVWPGMDLQADREVFAVSQWLWRNTRRIEKGDRPLSWRRLRPILVTFGCVTERAASGPGRYHIYRVIEVTGKRLGFSYSRRRQVESLVQFVDDGRDLGIPTIKKVRVDLELDEECGIDSAAFYGRGEPLASEFIMKYRKLLGKLARV